VILREWHPPQRVVFTADVTDAQAGMRQALTPASPFLWSYWD
jgi:hypothetical protein